MRISQIVFFIGLFGFWSSVAEARTADTTETKASLAAADAALARGLEREGVAALISALDSGSAILIPEQPILRGPEQARSALMTRYGAPARYEWRLKHVVVDTEGRFGCTIGIIRFTKANETRGGVYEACWRLTPGGQWRIVGLQSQDDTRPGHDLLYLIDAPMTRTPHSADARSANSNLVDVLDQDTRFAAMAADVRGPMAAFVEFAATDAISLISPDSARGHAELERLFGGMGGVFALLWNPDRSFGFAGQGLAFTVGRSVRIPLRGQAIPERHGKFLTIWRQNPDGSWRWILDLGSLRRFQPN